jgi:hypothetical protein
MPPLKLQAHVQLLTVANEVADYTQPKMDGIILGGVLVCGVAYLTVGLAGYFAYGDEVKPRLKEKKSLPRCVPHIPLAPSSRSSSCSSTPPTHTTNAHHHQPTKSKVNGNVLLSYPTKSFGVALARVAVSGLVGISYPLMCKPGRDSFLSLLRNSDKYKDAADGKTAYVGFTVST